MTDASTVTQEGRARVSLPAERGQNPAGAAEAFVKLTTEQRQKPPSAFEPIRKQHRACLELNEAGSTSLRAPGWPRRTELQGLSLSKEPARE